MFGSETESDWRKGKSEKVNKLLKYIATDNQIEPSNLYMSIDSGKLRIPIKNHKKKPKEKQYLWGKCDRRNKFITNKKNVQQY